MTKTFLSRMTIPKTRGTYWACTKVADWIRGTSILDSATVNEWKDWKEQAAAKHKIRYWIAEEGLDILQNIVFFPWDVFHNLKHYIINRFVDKVHYLPTNLTKGEWFDTDTRIIHGLFESLVQFVEGEKAHMERISNTESKGLTNREAGLKYLDWEIAEGAETQQLVASKVKSIYLWWKDVRPNRPDPWDASKLTVLTTNEPTLGEDEKIPKKLKKLQDEAYDKMLQISEEYEQEDTNMMIELIKIRRGLWT